MNSHINARTTPKSRVLIIERHQNGWSKSNIAASMGTSRQTVHKWIKRFQKEGEAGLHNRSIRPMRSPKKLAEGCLNAIVHFRTQHLMPAHQIAVCLKLAYSTVCRYLQILKLSRVSDIIPPEPTKRHERANPGEIIHIDIKKLGKFEQPGHRVRRDVALYWKETKKLWIRKILDSVEGRLLGWECGDRSTKTLEHFAF